MPGCTIYYIQVYEKLSFSIYQEGWLNIEIRGVSLIFVVKSRLLHDLLPFYFRIQDLMQKYFSVHYFVEYTILNIIEIV